MREKTVLVLSIIIASGLGVSTAIFGIMNIISTNSYNALMGDYENLSGDYSSLLTNYSGVLASYYDVNEKYQNLTEDYGDLNETYYILTGNYTELQGDYNDLSINYAKLIIDYNELQQNHTDLQSQYDNLLINYQTLQENYNNLSNDYNLLLDDYNELLDDYNDLSNQYDYLNDSYNTLKTYINTLILPVQYLVFAEAVRRYYMPLYLVDGMSDKEWYIGCVKLCRDMIIHDAWAINSFEMVSNAFSDCLKFGNDTMYLAFYIMYMNFYSWLPNWWGWGLSGVDNLTDIDTVHQWCVDEIDYEYDIDITFDQENQTWDYFKFPVETAFRTMGDCEDQAMLDAAYLQSCGFETAIAINHDPDHPMFTGDFCHGSLLVHIEDTADFYSRYPSGTSQPNGTLWNLGGIDPYEGFTWCWLDPTWNVPFGYRPEWLEHYIDTGFTWDIISIAICNLGDQGVGQPELQCSILN